jgi:hypothetical protein
MSFSTQDVDQVVDAIEALVEDMESRRHPSGTWTGHEHTHEVRGQLRMAILNLIRKATGNEGLA